MNRTVLVSGVLAMACGLVLAKLPPPDDAAKAKAAETAAKAAWQAKVDGYQLCKAQDKVAAAYLKTAAKATPRPAPVAAASAATSGTAAAASATAAPAAAAQAASGTPVASKPPGPCAEPGPFAYNIPEQKPLETAGAHSPTATAASPPSVKSNSAEMSPAKKP